MVTTKSAPAVAPRLLARRSARGKRGLEAGRVDGRSGRSPKRVIVTSIPSDSHTWNLVFLQLLLEEHGCVVTNLGHCAPIELVVGACEDERPDALIVSTVNGHGHIEGPELLEAIRHRAELSRMTAIIGGKLGTLGPGNVRFTDALLKAGYDAVFHEEDTPQALIGFLAGARAPELVP